MKIKSYICNPRRRYNRHIIHISPNYIPDEKQTDHISDVGDDTGIRRCG